MQKQTWKAPSPGLLCAQLIGDLRHKGISWTHHSVDGSNNFDSIGMVKVWSFGGVFCFAWFPVCNATLVPVFSFGKTHPMETNWVKCCSAVSLMPQVFGYCSSLCQCLICFSLWNISISQLCGCSPHHWFHPSPLASCSFLIVLKLPWLSSPQSLKQFNSFPFLEVRLKIHWGFQEQRPRRQRKRIKEAHVSTSLCHGQETTGGDWHGSSASLVLTHSKSRQYTLNHNSGISHMDVLLLGKGRLRAHYRVTGHNRGVTHRSISFLMITPFISD